MIVPCKTLWPPNDDPIERVLHFDWMAGRMGAQWPLLRPFLLVIRGVRPFAEMTHDLTHTPEYDDTGVFYAPGEKAVVLPMASHAYQARSKISPDENRDGLGDVGS